MRPLVLVLLLSVAPLARCFSVSHRPNTRGTPVSTYSSLTAESVVVRVADDTDCTTQAPQRPAPRWSGHDTHVKLGVLSALALALLGAASHDSALWQSAPDIVGHASSTAWHHYSQTLEMHPIETKACTSAIVYTIGDLIAQRTEGREAHEMDWIRVLRSMTAGLVGHGPMSHCWYNVCDGFFADVLHLTAWWSFIPKVVVDQTIWGPIWNNSYIVLLGLMKLERPETIWKDIRTSTIPLLVSGLKIWPAAHIVTYGFIPVENRLLWVDFVEIFWVTILATQAANLSSAATPAAEGKATEPNAAVVNSA